MKILLQILITLVCYATLTAASGNAGLAIAVRKNNCIPTTVYYM